MTALRLKVLALDTCFARCSAAVAIGAGAPNMRVVARGADMETGHAEHLLPMIGAALAEAGIAAADLDRIAVTHGPGSFTGTRIGVAAARALALAHAIPIVSMSSLEAIACDPAVVCPPGAAHLLVAIDAGRGEAYAQQFDAATRLPLGRPWLLPLDAAVEFCNGRLCALAGSASREIAERAVAAGVEVTVVAERMLPDARAILVRAAALDPGAPPAPLYLRPPDAKPPQSPAVARARGPS